MADVHCPPQIGGVRSVTASACQVLRCEELGRLCSGGRSGRSAPGWVNPNPSLADPSGWRVDRLIWRGRPAGFASDRTTFLDLSRGRSHDMYYNLVRSHRTLRVTPAMRAGLTNRVWSVVDIIGLLEMAEKEPAD